MKPLTVRLRLGHAFLELRVSLDSVLRKVNPKHLAWRQTTFLNDIFVLHSQDSSLRGKDKPVVFCDIVPARPQPIAVERSAHAVTVSVRDKCWSIPRFHDSRLVLVEVPQLLRHAGIILPSLRHHHGDHLRKGAASDAEHLEDIVENATVGLIVLDEWEAILQLSPNEIGLHESLARPHRVDVPPEGVDLSVVTEVPEGVRPSPSWERVRGEAAVHKRHA
mmetsp:Transcript_63498/g.168244  ORF Transcript_63498/g.168244 Transcript_63498/m.168244 type:complete len:220 (+) Transcript_63498:3594-4253(+)